MRKLVLLLALFSPLISFAEAMPIKYSTECVLKAILKHKGLEFRPDIEIPKVIVGSKSSLKEFQDAMEPQWKMRPENFTNAYAVHLNQIFLMDELAYYKRTNRFVDDSLAHELQHYVQVKYRGWALDGADDSLELDAINVQTWFREEFMLTGKNPCK
jgi:hypothetical protein